MKNRTTMETNGGTGFAPSPAGHGKRQSRKPRQGNRRTPEESQRTQTTNDEGKKGRVRTHHSRFRCRGCRQGRQGSRQGSRTHQHLTPPKAGQQMEPPPHPPPKAGKADSTQSPSPQSAPSSLKRAAIKKAPPALPQIHPSPQLYTKPAYQNKKGLLAGFNGSTHHPKRTTTPQIKPAEPPKAGRQGKAPPHPSKARRATQSRQSGLPKSPKQQHTPPAT